MKSRIPALLGFVPLNLSILLELFKKENIKVGRDYTALTLLIAVVYLVLGRAGLALSDVHTSVSAVWPASGFAVAMMILSGRKVLFGILLGAFAVNYSILPDVVVAVFIAIGNTGEAWGARWLYARFKQGKEIFTFRNLIILFGNAAFLATMIASTVGVAALMLNGYAQPVEASALWLEWWLGDAVGILVTAPLVLAIFTTTRKWSQADIIPAILVIALTVGVNLAIFVLFNISIAYLVVGPIMLAGEMFRRVGATVAVAITAIISTLGTVNGMGPFADAPILELQLFLGAAASFTLLYFVGRRDWKL